MISSNSSTTRQRSHQSLTIQHNTTKNVHSLEKLENIVTSTSRAPPILGVHIFAFSLVPASPAPLARAGRTFLPQPPGPRSFLGSSDLHPGEAHIARALCASPILPVGRTSARTSDGTVLHLINTGCEGQSEGVGGIWGVQARARGGVLPPHTPCTVFHRVLLRSVTDVCTTFW